MAIIFSSQTNINNPIGEISESLNILGFPGTNRNNIITPDIKSVLNETKNIIDKLLDKKNLSEQTYVGCGKQQVIGSNLQGGQASPIEEANIKQVYSQTPQLSVVIRKRAFSSLSHLYDAAYMDNAEKWLIRATKRLIERKCFIMSEYESLVKVKRMLNAGETTGSILISLISSSINDYGLDLSFNSELFNSNKYDIETKFTSARKLEEIIKARQPVIVSTFFKDPQNSPIPALGEGSGAFEITAISNLNTDLDIEGNGSCSFTIEDPYKILFVTEEDIEVALKETAPSNLQSARKGYKVTELLNNAQIADASLTQSRKLRNMSQITFSINVGSGVQAIIDALGFKLETNNLDDVPEGYELNDYEQTLFKTVMAGLQAYSELIRLNILKGIDVANTSQEVSENMSYVRKKMRLFYLGKSIIQPMDTINVFISSGTRKSGEGENVTEHGDIFTLDGAIKTVSSIFSAYRNDGQLKQGPNDMLLKHEWERFGKDLLTFEDFKRVRTMQLSTETGTHVFGGLVRSVNDRFEGGKYILNVQCDSNIEWLKISRYNSQPSLNQTQGLVYDPFTAFTYEIDKATGLPIGDPKLLPENRRRLSATCPNLYYDTGPNRGTKVSDIENLKVDIQRLGGNLKQMFQHVPGLIYRWKEGIMTAIYDMSTINPLNGRNVNYEQLRRDVGFFTSNTPFDNMDAANIISVMVTGNPYNLNTFLQSALNSGTFIPDTSLNNKKDYFSSLLDIQRSFIKTHGNFIPYKFFAIDRTDLAKALLLQQRLTGKSSEIQQLQSQYAELSDKIGNFTGNQNSSIRQLIKTLEKKRKIILTKLNTLQKNFSELTTEGQSLENNIIQIAGNDITFDLIGSTSNESYQLFGDNLFFSTLRRREDVIYNKDSNFLIISDEYDKDYDIQAFVLQLRQRSPDMWESTWQSVYQLCQTVAETLNFEFFCDTQGHLVFRPPQYNRTPSSVLAAMLSFSKNSGVTIFPNFLTKLFNSREESIINDITILEWDIVKNAALLGKTSYSDIRNLIGAPIIFVKSGAFNTRDAIEADAAIEITEKKDLLSIVENSNQEIQAQKKGIFSAEQQFNLFRELSNANDIGINRNSAKELYDNAIKNIANLTGRPVSNFEEFDKVKIGALHNGRSTPTTDISNLISKIAGLISRRSKLLLTLEKVLNQNIEMIELNENASVTLNSSNYLNIIDLFRRKNGDGIYNAYGLIEDDTRDVIGHMSGERFVIMDEHIISSSFTEQPPDMTVAAVSGTEPIVGEGQGKLAGLPLYLAYGVDFDLWRQYGWRNQKPFEKPFFWSADKQCAPYAVMLLSRQRKNIVTGSVTVMGNEYYQLGDVVYIADRQLLYYVTKISHSFTYNGDFKTTLELKYGHALGEYIPTPLDVIGKLSTSHSKTQSAFRMRREKSLTNIYLGTIRFTESLNTNLTEKVIMLNGKNGYNNLQQLINAAIKAKMEVIEDNIQESPRIYIMTYAGDETIQEERRKAVVNWFINPEQPASIGNNIGISSTNIPKKTNINNYKIDTKFIVNKHLRLCLSSESDFNEEEITLIKDYNMVAAQETLQIDNTLKNVVEIRLRRPPSNGW